jgi:hypothetical protein
VTAARAVLVSLLSVPAADALAQEVSLASVLERSAAYVANYRRQLSGIVAEEQYTQDERLAATATLQQLSGIRTSATHRELKSDFLLVPAPGADGLVEFRDVFEVDGKPVRDREDRLARLFLQRSPITDDQIRTIVMESARYNIGGVYRDMNTPTLPLLFLDVRYQSRFKFKRSNDTAPRLARGSMKSPRFTPLPGLWVVEYQETAVNTLIQRAQIGGNMPARGRFWIEPATGRVLMSEVIVSDPLMRATIDVAYQNAPDIDLLIPIEMRERYENNRDHTVTTGTATYSRIRRFDVQVKEDIAPVRP